MLGGKTYFFVNYEGSRFPNSYTFTAQDPSVLMRAGVIQVANSAGQYVPYNLNPTPVTVDGTTYQPAMCGTGLCDPRGIGISPAVKQIWNMMPLPNEFQATGDQYNVQGLRVPHQGAAGPEQRSDPHRPSTSPPRSAFSARIATLSSTTRAPPKYDIGGVFTGDKFGRDRAPWLTGRSTHR